MFSSISLYHQLHMFHLALTASHMALSPDGSALALADSERSHLEVYNLPGKLVAASGEEEGLTSNRDFGLVSGSVSCPGVTSVEYGDSRSVLTTSSHSQPSTSKAKARVSGLFAKKPNKQVVKGQRSILQMFGKKS